MIELTEKLKKAKQRFCVALGVSTVKEAIELVEELSDYVGMFKLGKLLQTAADNRGHDIIGNIYAKKRSNVYLNYGNGNVFFDLKLYDTPNTVYQTSKECVVPGVYMFNIHVAGGETMCKKALEGANEPSEYSVYGLRPKVIGVTVLTSLDDDDLVMRRTELARKWGLDGIECLANKAGELEKRFGSDFLYVTDGIEWAGKQGAGQKRLYTPDLAVRDCSNSILVIEDAITKAESKMLTAREILQVMAKEL